MTEATQEQGAELSIQQRIEQVIDPATETEELPESKNDATLIDEDAEPLDKDEPVEEQLDEDDEKTDAQNDDDDEVAESIELSTIAESLGIDSDLLDVDDQGQVTIRTKVGEDVGTANLSELVKSYQLEGHLNKKSMELSESQKSLDAERHQSRETVGAKVNLLDDSLRIALSQLTMDYSNVNWQELERTDPSAYNLTRTKFEDRKRQLDGAYQVIEQQRQEEAETNVQKHQEMLQDEQVKLLNLIPEWNTEQGYRQGAKELRDNLVSHYSLNDSEAESIGEITNHKVIMIMRDAVAYRALKDKAPGVTKRVKKAARIVKPSSKPSKDSQSGNANKAIVKLRKSGGNKHDVADYLMAKGIV